MRAASFAFRCDAPRTPVGYAGRRLRLALRRALVRLVRTLWPRLCRCACVLCARREAFLACATLRAVACAGPAKKAEQRIATSSRERYTPTRSGARLRRIWGAG